MQYKTIFEGMDSKVLELKQNNKKEQKKYTIKIPIKEPIVPGAYFECPIGYASANLERYSKNF